MRMFLIYFSPDFRLSKQCRRERGEGDGKGDDRPPRFWQIPRLSLFQSGEGRICYHITTVPLDFQTFYGPGK